MADGFFFADDPSLSRIKAQKALAQALMQKGLGDPGSVPYGGLSNAVNEVVGAYLNTRADKANSADYAKQIGALLGKNQPNEVQVTPQVQPDASGAPVPNAPSVYDQPAESFAAATGAGSLGMAPDKAKLLASILQGVDPDQGRQALQSMVLQQLEPKPLQWHPATDNAYDEHGNLIHQGTPPIPLDYELGPDGKTLVPRKGGPADPDTVARLSHIRRMETVNNPMPHVGGGRGGKTPKTASPAGYGNPSSFF